MGIERRRNWLVSIGASLLILLGLGLALLYGFGLASSGASGLFSIGGKDAKYAPEVGALAPDFMLTTIQGEEVRLSEQTGAPVLVNFWATWCAPCVLEMTTFQEYVDRYPGAFKVIAVNADEPKQRIEQFVKDMGLTFWVVEDPGGKVQALYRLRGYPTTYFVDARGEVRYLHIGLLTEGTLQEYLTEMGALQ